MVQVSALTTDNKVETNVIMVIIFYLSLLEREDLHRKHWAVQWVISLMNALVYLLEHLQQYLRLFIFFQA